VTHVFNVPGDFNLPLLDSLAKVPGLTLVNTSNELNSAYAAGNPRGLAVPGHRSCKCVVRRLLAIQQTPDTQNLDMSSCPCTRISKNDGVKSLTKHALHMALLSSRHHET
jgi:hypothetical protein